MSAIVAQSTLKAESEPQAAWTKASTFYARDIGWGWDFLMGIGMVAFWLLIVLGAVWLVRGGFGGTASQQHPSKQPIEILNRRLADGELTLEEYEERREAIERVRDSDRPSV